jgi:CheY-like chemotaxis protein/Tfp pilus assembly protein PilF
MRLDFEPSATLYPIVDTFDQTGSHHNQASDLLDEGVKAARAGERLRARAALLQAVDLDPRLENGWLWLASISETPEELLGFLERVLTINPENERALEWMAATKKLLAKTFVQRAADAIEAGRIDDATRYYHEALGADGENAAAWLGLASMESIDDEKIKWLDRLLAFDPQNQEALRERSAAGDRIKEQMLGDAKLMVAEGRKLEAFAMLDTINAASPKSAEAWLLRWHLAETLDDKLAALEKACAADPANALAVAALEWTRAFLEEVAILRDRAAEAEAEARQTSDRSWPQTAEPAFSDAAIKDFFVPPADDRSNGYAPEVALDQPAEEEADDTYKIPMPDDSLTSFSVADREDQFMTVADTAALAAEANCPFCGAANPSFAMVCQGCLAALTVVDIDRLLWNPHADKFILRDAVERMERELADGDAGEAELTTLGIAHLQLGNYQAGYEHLQNALTTNPDNIVLAGQVSAVHVRIEEIRRQNEARADAPKGKTILVVDDSATVRKLIAGKLEKCSHSVFCAGDGREALERLQELVPDLMLVDITMPGMDGYEVCRRVRANGATKDVPVVMISGKDGAYDSVRGEAAGASGFITKPFGPETLMKAVDAVLKGDAIAAE